MRWTQFLLSTMATSTSKSSGRNGIHWFRKGLRLKDNPALVKALDQNPAHLYPVYVLDGNSYQLRHCTALRANFLVECLQDLDENLRKRGSRLYIASGDPVEVLPKLWKEWSIDFMSCEEDESGEPYASKRDEAIGDLAKKEDIEIFSVASETLFPLRDYVLKAGSEEKVPSSMGPFDKLFGKMGKLAQVLPAPDKFPKLDPTIGDEEYRPPRKPTDLPWPRETPRNQVEPVWGPEDCKNLTPLVHGGETNALQQLQSTVTARPTFVAKFEKPKTSCTEPNKPSTTVLSPYMSWGCLSPRVVWNAIAESAARSNATTTKPPVSLHGQLLWRDFNNLMAHMAGDTWGQMEGNPYCRPIPWGEDDQLLEAWKKGRTGYPWIDACMTQLEQEGWIHHLGRHAVACFLTRGDLWQSWEKGALHFESRLLDADHALNGFNWLWLSCSGFFYQYFRCYSPIAFQKKNDPSGKYIRKYVPVLAKLPDKYIYEPWTAPKDVQNSAGIKIGVDYPKPIVDHGTVHKANMGKMKEAYDAFKESQQQSQPKSRGKAPSGRSSKEPAKKKQKQSKLSLSKK